MIGFVIPMEKEAKRLLSLLAFKTERQLAGRKIVQGRLGDQDCVVVISGCGKILSASTTQLLIDNLNCAAIFHMGVAGALSKDLKIGDIVIGEEIIEHDWYRRFGAPEPVPASFSNQELVREILQFAQSKTLRVFSGKIVSGNEDIVTTKRRNELCAQYQGLSVDWESCGCAQVCNMAGIPVLVLRVVVDYAYENTNHEFGQNLSDVSGALCDFAANFITAGGLFAIR